MPDTGLRLLRKLALWLPVCALAYVGWRLFYFTCDDAYIAFRYVQNSMLGRGLVWNPAPFLPVEGYTSFLWVVVLRATWSLTGVEPPVASNLLSLFCGYATLYVGWRMMLRLPLSAAFARHRFAFAAIVLVGTVTNRAFLTWLTSGLETAAFNLWLTTWIYFATGPAAGLNRRWALGISTTATLAALTRPDGLLLVPATIALLVHDTVRGAGRRSWLATTLASLPLAGVAAHLLWRRSFYGAWLPNTYDAKHLGSWPESGWRYATSFVVENGAWVWIAIALAWAIVGICARRRGPRALLGAHFGPAIVVAVVAFHFAFYTFEIGGDHFEYRVYSHLPLLLLVSIVWLADRTTRRPALGLSSVIALVLASYPIAWLHFVDAPRLKDHLPAFVRPIVRGYEDLQSWLNERMVCTRWARHAQFARARFDELPARDEGARIGWEERPVTVAWAVGILGWQLPNVAVVDMLGLNDRVIARAPLMTADAKYAKIRASTAEVKRAFERCDSNHDDRVGRAELVVFLEGLAAKPDRRRIDELADEIFRTADADADGWLDRAEVLVPTHQSEGAIRALSKRKMLAHEERDLPGYVESFRPNVFVRDGEFVVEPRESPLTDEEIVGAEKRFRALVARSQR